MDNAACAAVGVVNNVTVAVTWVAARNDPAVSLTIKVEPVREAAHVGLPVAGAVTVQTLVAPSAIPAPDRMIAMPALVPAVIAPAGVNEMVAVVDVALAFDVRETASPVMAPLLMAGKVPVVVASRKAEIGRASCRERVFLQV